MVKAILLLLILAFGLGLAIFPELRTWLKGATKLFIRDRLANPEEAEAFYTELIEEQARAYNEAHTKCAMIGGNYTDCKREVERLTREIRQCEQTIEVLFKSGKEEEAQLANENWVRLTDCLTERKRALEELYQAGADATEAMNLMEKQLKDLKKEKEQNINTLKTKKQIAEAYQSLNEIKSTANDRAREHINDKAREVSALADGERMMYNSRTSVKLEKAEREAKASTGGYLGQLKAKSSPSKLLEASSSMSRPVEELSYSQAKAKEKVRR